jgi:hypothetical protein
LTFDRRQPHSLVEWGGISTAIALVLKEDSRC